MLSNRIFKTLSLITAILFSAFDVAQASNQGTVINDLDLNSQASPNYRETLLVVTAIDDSDLPGYVSQIPQFQSKVIDLFIFGNPSTVISEFAAQHPKVLIRIHKSKFSRQRLQGANKQLTDLISSGVMQSGVHIRSFRIQPDGTGLLIGYNPEEQTPSREWIHSLSGEVGVDVQVFPDTDEIVPLSTRANDAEPWHAGALFTYTDKLGIPTCSLGFGVVSTTTGNEYSTTARHCFPDSSDVYTETFATAKAMGTWSSTYYYNYPDHDLSLVKPKGGVVSQYTYNGPFYTSTITRVTQVGLNYPGAQVCINGGNSGRHCDVWVTNYPISTVNGDLVVSGLYSASRVNNSIVVAEGDSGGPVTSENLTPGVLLGNGIVYGGLKSSLVGDCSSHNTPTNGSVYLPAGYAPDQCYSVVYFTDLESDLNISHMRLK